MPLRFEPPADPLNATATSVSHVIESDALQRLTKEIERYGRRALAGRSILIAGHRGVGKTTLVRKAIENVRGSTSLYEGRPLFVDLHGPDLLAPPEKEPLRKAGDTQAAEAEAPIAANNAGGGIGAGDKPANGNAEATEADSKNSDPNGTDGPVRQPSGADLQSFVERLTFSLYRAAAKEFVESFRLRRNTPGPSGESRYAEFSELAEQFAMELDGSTDLGRIRLLYERVGAFDNGVLDTSKSVTGSQELALLAASSQAYRIISGKLDEDQKRETSGKNAVSWSVAADNLISPVAGLLTGGLVWAALPAGSDPLGKLFASFTAGLAAAVVVKFTRTIQRESKQSSKVTFVPERNRMALRRLLPVLVERFCDVGLPPIFVVDELDKVQDISARMEDLMGFLKQFVTERAFFCFLVDREYYERLEATVSTSAFPKEATLFGDRLFVQYAPEAAHEFLKKVTTIGTIGPDENQDDAARDLEVLRYVLLRRSYMHPFDLRREISRSTNAQNEFRFPPRALFNVQQYRNEVYYQVAVECVLAGEKLLDFAEDPNHAQLLYDALYFPIRTRKLPQMLDASRDSLKEHLADRMGKDNGKLLGEEDLDILYDALLQLVGFLCEPRVLLDRMQALAMAKYLPQTRVFPQAALGVIEAAAGPKPPPPIDSAAPTAADQSASTAQPPASPSRSAPLLAAAEEDGQYTWQFDKYGYPVVPRIAEIGGAVRLEAFGPQAVTQLAPSGLPESVTSLIDDFETTSQAQLTRQGTAIDIELWERMRLIPVPPTWSYLREAADALRNPASIPPTKIEEYGKAFVEYRSNLLSALQRIWSAVAIAVTMAVHDRKSTPAQPERHWLEVLAEVLAEAPGRDQMLIQLDEIATDAVTGSPLNLNDLQPEAKYGAMLNAIETAATTLRARPPVSPSDVAQQAANFYEKWFVQFYTGRRPKIDSIWPFLSLAVGSLPFGLRTINPLKMTIADWTAAFSQQGGWQRLVSLERLGLRREAEQELGKVPLEDDLPRALARSIRQRGYQKATVELQPLQPSLTDVWLPSENIGCRIRTPDTKPDGKYLLIEVDERTSVDQFGSEWANLGTATRIALFGRLSPSPTIQNRFRGYPYVPAPQSLDDLVERLDARPPSDWSDPKSSASAPSV